MEEQSSEKILVPVGESDTIRKTVAYSIREAIKQGREQERKPKIHFIYPIIWEKRRSLNEDIQKEAKEFLERIDKWIEEDLEIEKKDEEDSLPIDIETSVVGKDSYLFSPSDYSDTIVNYARKNDLDRIILDPDYQPSTVFPLLNPLGAELERYEEINFEEAPVERPIRRRILIKRKGDLRSFIAILSISYLFYIFIGEKLSFFNIVTGLICATIAGFALSGITFRKIELIRSGLSFIRWIIYIPYLLWEISIANLKVAYLVLHPDMPINPKMVRFEPEVWYGIPITTLANSITLTPGTLTVDVRQRDFYIHTLDTQSRISLLNGSLEKAVRFIFYGRQAISIPSPKERNDFKMIDFSNDNEETNEGVK